MKKFFFSLAFMLIGSFAFANNSVDTKSIDKTLNSNKTILVECSTKVNGDKVTITCVCNSSECKAKLKKAVDALAE